MSRKPLDPDLYADVVEEAKTRFAVWPSAYASGWVVKTYKARGGRYGGESKGSRTGLTKWFGESWVDLSRPIREDGEVVGYEPCGRKRSDDPADYPKCRPEREAMRMSKEEVADAVRRKRRAEASAPARGSRARAPQRVATYRQNPQKTASLTALRAAREHFAAVAQKIYDAWDASGDYGDGEVGFGGICHLIADALVEEISAKTGFNAVAVSSSHEVHVYVVVKTPDGIYSVDIHPHVYETGGGYSWQKIPDVVFDVHDIVIDFLSSDPRDMREFVDDWYDEDEDEPQENPRENPRKPPPLTERELADLPRANAFWMDFEIENGPEYLPAAMQVAQWPADRDDVELARVVLAFCYRTAPGNY